MPAMLHYHRQSLNPDCTIIVFFWCGLIGRWTPVLPLCLATHSAEYLQSTSEPPATDGLVMLPLVLWSRPTTTNDDQQTTNDNQWRPQITWQPTTSNADQQTTNDNKQRPLFTSRPTTTNKRPTTTTNHIATDNDQRLPTTTKETKWHQRTSTSSQLRPTAIEAQWRRLTVHNQ